MTTFFEVVQHTLNNPPIILATVCTMDEAKILIERCKRRMSGQFTIREIKL